MLSSAVQTPKNEKHIVQFGREFHSPTHGTTGRIHERLGIYYPCGKLSQHKEKAPREAMARRLAFASAQRYFAGMKSDPLPSPLTPTERIALEWIKAGKEPTTAAREAVMRHGWAKRVKGRNEVTEAGERALANDAEARASSRSARTRPAR